MAHILKDLMSINNIRVFLFAFYALLSFKPYYIWNTYNNAVFTWLPYIIFAILFTFAIYDLLFLRQKVNIKFIKLAILTLLLGVFLKGICGLGNWNHLFSISWRTYLIFIVFILQSKDLIIKEYIIFKKILLISLIPSFLFYFLGVFNIDIPFSVVESPEIGKANAGCFYINYPMTIQLRSIYPLDDYFLKYRLCGIFNEPGVIGTLCALLILLDKFSNSKVNIFFLICGIASFSLAFYVLLFLGALFNYIIKLDIKKVSYFMLTAILYFSFMNLSYDNEMLTKLQSRLNVTSAGIQGDNRYNHSFSVLYDNFNNEDIDVLLLGKGEGYIQDYTKIDEELNVSSYKSLVLEYGYLGFIVILSFVYFVICNLPYRIRNKNYEVYCFFLYITNMYQRPSVLDFNYIFLLISALYYYGTREERLTT